MTVSNEADPMLDLRLSRSITFGQLLRSAARARPHKVGFTIGDRSVTLAELDRRVDRLANALSAAGVTAGEPVTLLMTNRMEMLEALFAILRIGAIAMPVNFRLGPQEVSFLVEDSGATAILVEAALAGIAGAVREKMPQLSTCIVVGLDGLAQAGPGAQEYEALMEGASEAPFRAEVADDAPAFLMYTSGTTGMPKGAVLSHRSLVVSGLLVGMALGVQGTDEVWLSGLPLFHIGGIDFIVPYVLLSEGAGVIMSSSHFTPERALDALEESGATGCFFVPTQWQAICDAPDASTRKLAVRRIAIGAAPALTPLLLKMAERFPGTDFIHAFGQTETCGTTTLYISKDPFYKMGSVGRPIPGVDFRIVDDSMSDVPVGAVGEVVYRGPLVFDGYWNRPEANAEAFAGGWFHSGDLCRMDEDGYVFVVDRKKDIIISGGENISSHEIESIVLEHPKVREVAVVAVPHPTWGETPQAVIVPVDPNDPPSGADIADWCEGRLASFKRPTSVHIVEELPHNASGKVMKHLLRPEASAIQP